MLHIPRECILERKVNNNKKKNVRGKTFCITFLFIRFRFLFLNVLTRIALALRAKDYFRTEIRKKIEMRFLLRKRTQSEGRKKITITLIC